MLFYNILNFELLAVPFDYKIIHCTTNSQTRPKLDEILLCFSFLSSDIPRSSVMALPPTSSEQQIPIEELSLSWISDNAAKLKPAK